MIIDLTIVMIVVGVIFELYAFEKGVWFLFILTTIWFAVLGVATYSVQVPYSVPQFVTNMTIQNDSSTTWINNTYLNYTQLSPGQPDFTLSIIFIGLAIINIVMAVAYLVESYKQKPFGR